MFSKISIKLFGLLVGLVILYSVSIVFIISPKIEQEIIYLEKRNIKKELASVSNLIKSTQLELESYKNISLNAHKEELRHTSQMALFLINQLYEQTNEENIKRNIRKESQNFQKMLYFFYNQKKAQGVSQKVTKEHILNFIQMYRYDNYRGYFFVSQGTKIILQPTNNYLNGTDQKNLTDLNGKYFIQEIAQKAKQEGGAFVNYVWQNPISKEFEEKITYVTTFKPFNWIIGTGTYLPEIMKNRKERIKEYISTLKHENNYLFALDYNYQVVSESKGSNSDLHTEYSKMIIKELVEKAKKEKEGYVKYLWKHKDGSLLEKLTYFKNFDKANLVIATWIDLEDIHEEIEKRKRGLFANLKSLIKETKVSADGYIYIIDSEGKVVIHPNEELEGIRLSSLGSGDSNKNFFNNLKEAYNNDRAFHYKWNKKEDLEHFKYDKLSYIEYNDYFEWYIVSSVYVDNMIKSSQKMKNMIFIIMIFILGIAFFMSIVFVRKITEPIEELSSMAQKVKDGNYAVRSDIKSSDEMEILAKAFNDMLDTIEENINTLDMKVKTRTVELENRLHELRQAQAQLVQSEKLASLGSMVAGVAHEINTPVGMALTGTTHLNDETKELKRLYDADEISEEDFEEYINNASNLTKSILINLQRAIQLVRSFKQVAVDQSSYEVRKFYLREYIYEILDSLHNRIKKTHHNIRVEVDKSLEFNSIPGIFSQILTNFIMNSLIHGFKDTKSGQITIKAHKSNENVILIYEDNGVGLSNTVQERIFDPFFTTNRENGGSGLGMNIVYNLVTRKLNGSISARNGEEGGVVFIIDVPLVTTITPQEES